MTEISSSDDPSGRSGGGPGAGQPVRPASAAGAGGGGRVVPWAGVGDWRAWSEQRIGVLRAALELAGWSVESRGQDADRYELELGEEGSARVLVPRRAGGPNADRWAADAAHTLIDLSGDPHLELGPLSARDSAWAKALAAVAEATGAPVPVGSDERAEPVVMSHVDRQARRPWKDIPADYRHVGTDGVRRVLGWDDATGGTVLAPWVGPVMQPRPSGATSSSAADEDARSSAVPARLEAYDRQAHATGRPPGERSDEADQGRQP